MIAENKIKRHGNETQSLNNHTTSLGLTISLNWMIRILGASPLGMTAAG